MLSSYFLFLETMCLVHFFQVVRFQSHMPTSTSWVSCHCYFQNRNAKGFRKWIQSCHKGQASSRFLWQGMLLFSESKTLSTCWFYVVLYVMQSIFCHWDTYMMHAWNRFKNDMPWILSLCAKKIYSVISFALSLLFASLFTVCLFVYHML